LNSIPSARIELAESQKIYAEHHVPLEPLTERVRHIVQSVFNGRRMVIFSGGARKEDSVILDDVRAILAGGGFGSIVGRNSFQRDRATAMKLLGQMISIYKAETV